MVPGFIEDAQKSAEQVKERLKKLEEYEIPLVLAHGDFARRNVGFKVDESGEESMVLFDWQFAAISHPSFDFHQFGEKVQEAELDEYLSKWTKKMTLDRVKEAYELANVLGWLLKISVIMKCLDASDPQEGSEMREAMVTCWEIMISYISYQEERELTCVDAVPN